MEKQKKMCDLSVSELLALAKKNKTLKNKVLDSVINNADFWVSEYTSSAPFEWQGGYCYPRFISKVNFQELPDYINKLISDFGAFYQNEDKMINNAELLKDLDDKLNYPDYYHLNDLNYTRIENRAEELKEDLTAAIERFIFADYEYLEHTADDTIINDCIDCFDVANYFDDETTTDGVNIYETKYFIYQ